LACHGLPVHGLTAKDQVIKSLDNMAETAQIEKAIMETGASLTWRIEIQETRSVLREGVTINILFPQSGTEAQRLAKKSNRILLEYFVLPRGMRVVCFSDSFVIALERAICITVVSEDDHRLYRRGNE
jgi:hypothetical protein